jgi:hypothetical protein
MLKPLLKKDVCKSLRTKATLSSLVCSKPPAIWCGQERSILMKKSTTFRFARGLTRTSSAPHTSRLPSHRSIARRTKRFRGSKDSAHKHLAQIREMIAILQNHDVAVRMLKSRRVGYVVYEDEYQVVAEPFADIQC